jgi:hypothetical protein
MCTVAKVLVLRMPAATNCSSRAGPSFSAGAVEDLELAVEKKRAVLCGFNLYLTAKINNGFALFPNRSAINKSSVFMLPIAKWFVAGVP